MYNLPKETTYIFVHVNIFKKLKAIIILYYRYAFVNEFNHFGNE